MKGRNDILLQDVQEHWSINLHKDIQFHFLKNTFHVSFTVTLDTFSRLIYFKLIHNRVVVVCLFAVISNYKIIHLLQKQNE